MPDEAEDVTQSLFVPGRPGWQLAMGALPAGDGDGPPEAIVRGACADCGSPIVANLYWHAERGYLLRYECWSALRTEFKEGGCRWYAVP